MRDYFVPILPMLNFIKKDDSYYFFHSEEGKIGLEHKNKTYSIYDLKIKVSKNINIVGHIKKQDFKELFCQKSEDGTYEKVAFQKTSRIKCVSGVYAIYISNCLEITSCFDNDCWQMEFDASNIEFIKNDEKLYEGEVVNIWHVFESSMISQNGFREFNLPNLKKLLLKSQNTLDYKRDFSSEGALKRSLELEAKRNESFNQLLRGSSFIFNKTSWDADCCEEIRNIGKMSMFFDPLETPVKMEIVESCDSDKLVIIIKSDENKDFSNSIFSDSPYNFCSFINSSYNNYIKLKDSEIDIDLLLEYYVLFKNELYVDVKIILGSIFMEVLKNNKINPSLNEFGSFAEKISKILSNLKINTIYLLKFLQPELYNVLDNVTALCLIKNYSKISISLTCHYFKKNYVIALINFYRNKTIHSGNFEIGGDELIKFIDNWKGYVKMDLPFSYQLIDEIADCIKNNVRLCASLEDVSIQFQVFECIVDLIMLKLFDADCELCNLPYFEELLEKGRFLYSKELIDKFKVPWHRYVHYVLLKFF